MRTFIAIEFSPHVHAVIQSQTAHLRHALGDDSIRWVSPGNLHLTLRFLGETVGTHLQFVRQTLAHEAGGQAPFELQLGGVGAFPNSRSPKVLWLGIQAPAALFSLQRSLETAFRRLGYEPENRPFSPHLTLGRVRQGAAQPALQKIGIVLDRVQPGNIAIARVDAIHLFKSDLQPGAPVYSKLFSATLSRI